MKKTTALLTLSALVITSQLAGAGDITGTITLKGTPPKEKDITPLKDDPTCGKLHTEMPTTHFYVVGPKGELADVVVSLQGVSGKSTGASAPAAMLDQRGCEYIPQILAVQTNQKIDVKNSDPVLHNIHDLPNPDSGNPEKNMAQMPNGPELSFTFAKPEEFLKFKCDVHPWMFAWVSVFDHPYFAISAKDGTFKISNVPPGKYTLKAAHRKAGAVTQEIEVKEGAPATAELTLEAK
ncbi:MAG TPA: carboxypeptidase regulatory-like domain-containing protein [Verrucomicrobiae bacterium]|nr:carboxypeptidase regulatory-like domain-containing protein [Verrucomicrobiae bacterium]